MSFSRLTAQFFFHDVTADRMVDGRAQSVTVKDVLYIRLSTPGERGHVDRAATEADMLGYAAEYEAFLHPEPDPASLKAQLDEAHAENERLAAELNRLLQEKAKAP